MSLKAAASVLPYHYLHSVVDDVGQRVAVVELEVLSFVERGAQPDRDVARDVVATHRQHREVPRAAVVVDDDIGRAGADLDQAHAKLHLLRRQHAFTARQPYADDILDVEARPVDALDDVLDSGLGAGDGVGLDL